MALLDISKWLVVAWAGVGTMLLVGCGHTEVVSIDGSSTVFLLSAAAAEQFREHSPEINVVVGQSGTGGGFKKFAAGEIDVCNASRAIKPAEAEACRAAGVEFIEIPIAYDGLAVVASRQNDWCDVLTVEQLRSIWRRESQGAIMSWRDVDADWPREPLKLYGPGADSGTFDYFTEVINGIEGVCRQDYSPSENDNALVTGVAGDRGALGYFGYGYYAENKDKLKLLAVDGGEGPVLPDPETVRSGKYQPLARPLFIYVNTAALGRSDVSKFLEFYLEHAAALAPQVGYVALPDDLARQGRESLAEALSRRRAEDAR
ncbi:MAG TPA: PstS family phosphate ABC transporter substrate-binding protein [Lacipirellulaceae bacterium]|nr:PstS family phosphate ABC transporter substrate-binding protein [Lacipirellulaceae bacterium]HMP06134.1 PstS family phosphate ABC transporter substrate-binding protein [Lacipirellulaceae bacterium]